MTKVTLKKVNPPKKDNEAKIYQLTDETMKFRKEKVLAAMEKSEIDTLVIYCDLEHGGNFSYLTGFVTRFEESLLVLHQTGEAFLVLGNENTKMVDYSRIEAELIHTPLFSLPDQPMDNEKPLTEVLTNAKISKGKKVGLVGWKMFTSEEDNYQIQDLPAFIVSSIVELVGEDAVSNRTDLFIHSDYGVRSLNTANEVAYYEFGSSLASDCVMNAIDEVEVGKTEMEIGNHLVKYGQPNNVIPIAATGERFENAYIYPTDKQVKLGDKMSITTGFKGGLASRSGYAVATTDDLPEGQKDYIEKVAAPYYDAVVAWLENIKIGMQGKELYSVIGKVLPKSEYKWHLNPGHLTADEEWMSSPMKKDSEITLKSGMLLQIDIIPSVAGYAGASCESGIALADEPLRDQLAKEYPNVWSRIISRQEYIRNELGIELPDEVLPLSSGVGYYTPFFLEKNLALVKG
ncbi:M24 family metallopeptidase [Enterococcus gallinarum]|uniref:M24 family metallopeptidase n=1 Tax=Enterococcus gallinarum TaxID=1353 RepID=UPI00115DEF11|nr:aminopeptidase P family protein [Enterococcus gallinarum]